MCFLGMGVRIFREILAVSIPFSDLFLKKNRLGFIMVCHIAGYLGTKVVISALGMLALYMRFNGTGIWGGETM